MTNRKIAKLITGCLCVSLAFGAATPNETHHVGYKFVQGKAENGVAVYVDKSSNAILYTEYLGDHFGVLVRCILSDQISTDSALKVKVRDLVMQFVPSKYQQSILNELDKKKMDKLQNDKVRLDVPGKYSECFIEVAYVAEGEVITIKCVR